MKLELEFNNYLTSSGVFNYVPFEESFDTIINAQVSFSVSKVDLRLERSSHYNLVPNTDKLVGVVNEE